MAKILGFGTNTTADNLKAAQADWEKKKALLKTENERLVTASLLVGDAADDALPVAIDERERLKAYVEQREARVTAAHALVEQLTAAVAAEIEAVNRERTAKEIEARLECFTADNSNLITALNMAAKSTSEAAEIAVDLQGYAVLLGQLAANDVPPVVASGIQWLKDRARDTRHGSAPALLKAPPVAVKAAAKKIEQPAVPTLAAFVLNPIVYLKNGVRTRGARGATIQLTAEQLAAGHGFGLVAPFDHRDQRQKQIISVSNAAQTPEWHHCKDVMTGILAGPIIQDLPPKTAKHSRFNPDEVFSPLGAEATLQSVTATYSPTGCVSSTLQQEGYQQVTALPSVDDDRTCADFATRSPRLAEWFRRKAEQSGAPLSVSQRSVQQLDAILAPSAEGARIDRAWKRMSEYERRYVTTFGIIPDWVSEA